MLQNLSIRSKLIAIFILPMLMIAILAGVRVVSSLRSGFESDRVKKVTLLARDVAGLADELQTERDLTALYVAAPDQQGRDQVAAQRARTDRQVHVVQARLGQINLDDYQARLGKN